MLPACRSLCTNALKISARGGVEDAKEGEGIGVEHDWKVLEDLKQKMFANDVLLGGSRCA